MTGHYDIDAAITAARIDEHRQPTEACRYCGEKTPRGHARCGNKRCNRTLWRVRGEDQQ